MTSPCIYPCERCNMTIESWTDENPFCQKCEMIEEGKKIFRETHPHENAEYLLSRSLENAIYSTRGECADCRNMSKFLITEKKEVDLCGECGKDKTTTPYYNSWYWCGMCLVG